MVTDLTMLFLCDGTKIAKLSSKNNAAGQNLMSALLHNVAATG